MHFSALTKKNNLSIICAAFSQSSCFVAQVVKPLLNKIAQVPNFRSLFRLLSCTTIKLDQEMLLGCSKQIAYQLVDIKK